jgi:hypothetical protein
MITYPDLTIKLIYNLKISLKLETLDKIAGSVSLNNDKF